VTDTAPRHVLLEGAVNFRDVGGYPTRDGRSTAWNKVFRSDGLSELSDADLETIATLGIRSVLDLRTTFEFESGVFPIDKVDVTLSHLPLMESVPDPESFKKIPGFLASTYVEMLEEAGDHVAQALRIVADPANLPAIIHCTVGKDRTGVLVAVILSLLGVANDTIVADYALSAGAMEAVKARLIARFPDAEELINDHAAEILSAEGENMIFLLDAVAEKWGSMEAYVATIGLSDDDLVALRAALLE
jgi:protein-tyrosine phosphatase